MEERVVAFELAVVSDLDDAHLPRSVARRDVEGRAAAVIVAREEQQVGKGRAAG